MRQLMPALEVSTVKEILWTQQLEARENEMDVTTIRIVAGVLAVAVLGIIIWRRRGKAIE